MFQFRLVSHLVYILFVVLWTACCHEGSTVLSSRMGTCIPDIHLLSHLIIRLFVIYMTCCVWFPFWAGWGVGTQQGAQYMGS